MASKQEELNQSYIDFIKEQPLFFVATADTDGYVNVSPKRLDSLRVLNNKELLWLSVSGSSNETAAHVRATGRMTMMFCAFSGKPLILRVYGTATAFHAHDAQWQELMQCFPDYPGTRNIFKLNIELVTMSCGTGVPQMQVVHNRADTDLLPWYDSLGAEGMEQFWRKKNVQSLNGKPTGLFDPLD